MEWNDSSESETALLSTSVIDGVVGAIAIIGAVVCTLDKIHRETGLLGSNSGKSQSGSKKK